MYGEGTGPPDERSIAVKLAPHLHRLGNDIVAAYLIDTPEGITLVDAGLPGHWSDLQKELASLGKQTSDIKGLILTHGDSDHIGFAERLREEAGVPVYVHAADAVRARTGEKPKTPMGRLHLGPTVGFFAYSLRKKGYRTTYLEEVEEVADGDVLPLPGAPVVISMPGHSPGSIAVHVPVADAVFVGDALTTRHVLTGRPGPQPAPFTDDPAEAAGSLDRLAELQVSWVLPGHGTPWHGSPSEIATAVRAAAV
jgi:glyoxylase-like metal-dependent hydrolase (beta-lactamase superfamily II)